MEVAAESASVPNQVKPVTETPIAPADPAVSNAESDTPTLAASASVGDASTATPSDESGPSAKVEADDTADAPSRDPLDALDDTLDRALGQAASGLWSFAARVQSAVPPEAGAQLAGLREGAAPKLGMLAAGMKDVVGSVQRNAVAVEEALLDAAQSGVGAAAGGLNELAASGAMPNSDSAVDAIAFAQMDASGFLAATNVDFDQCGDRGGDGERELGKNGDNANSVEGEADGGNGGGDAGGDGGGESSGLLPTKKFGSSAGYIREDLDVNAELARAAQTLQNSAQTLQDSVAPVGENLKNTVGGLFGSLSQWAVGNETDGAGGAGDNSPSGVRDAPVTRFQGLVRDLEVNPDTYCEPPGDLDAFQEWAVGFDLDKLEAKCIALLDRHPAVADLYERVVPNIIEENTFWMRYFFARDALDAREEQRMKLLQRAVGGTTGDDDETGGWDDDDDEDWDDPEDKAEDSDKQKSVNDAVQNEEKGTAAAGLENNEGDGVSVAESGQKSEVTTKGDATVSGDGVDTIAGQTESGAANGAGRKPPKEGVDSKDAPASADDKQDVSGSKKPTAPSATVDTAEMEADDDSDDWE